MTASLITTASVCVCTIKCVRVLCSHLSCLVVIFDTSSSDQLCVVYNFVYNIIYIYIIYIQIYIVYHKFIQCIHAYIYIYNTSIRYKVGRRSMHVCDAHNCILLVLRSANRILNMFD